MAKSGRGHMPQFGPSLLDDQGITLIHDWIVSLGGKKVTDPAVAVRKRLCDMAPPFSSRNQDWVEGQLNSVHSALTVSSALCGDKVDPAIRREIAVLAATDYPATGDLFERYLPEHLRVKRLGNSIDASALVALTGNAESGRRMFVEAADVNCRQCHRIGETGVAVGPDPSGVGARRTRAEILRSLVNPSEKIDETYRGKAVLTVDGGIVAGMVVKEDEQTLTLVETSGKQRTIPQADVESVKTMQKSVMPDLLLAEFTAQQAADLLAFLSEQKQATDLGNAANPATGDTTTFEVGNR